MQARAPKFYTRVWAPKIGQTDLALDYDKQVGHQNVTHRLGIDLQILVRHIQAYL